MSKKFLIFIICFTLFFCQNKEIYPSLKYKINEIQLKTLEKQIIDKFLNNKDLPIRGYNFSEKIDFIGTVQFNMTDSKFKFIDLKEKTFEILFESPDKISIKLDNVKAQISFYYIFRSNFYSNKGTGKIEIKETTLKMDSKILRIKNKIDDTKFGPGIEIESFSIDAKDFEFDFEHEGTLEKMIEYILLNGKNALVNIIKDKFNTDYRPMINKQLYTLSQNSKLIFPIANTKMTVHYSMNNEPKITKNYLIMEFEAEIKHPEIKYTKDTIKLPDFNETNYAIELIISQFLFDNLLFIAGKDKLLDGILYNEVSKFTVGIFKDCFKNITTKHDSNELVDLGLFVKESPEIYFEDGKAYILINENLTFYTRKTNTSERVIAISGDTVFEFNVKFNIEKSKISASIESGKMKSFKTTYTTFEQDDESVVKDSEILITGSISLLNIAIQTALAKIHLPTIEGIELHNFDFNIKDNLIDFGILPII